MEENGVSVAWSTMAYAFTGFGISFKIIPIIIVPFLVLADSKASRPDRRLIIGLFALLSAAVFPFVIQYAISGPGIFELFIFHSQRGIQIESLYSTLMMIGSLFGSDIFMRVAYGGVDLAGDSARWMIIFSTIMLILFLSCAWLRLLFWPRESSRLMGYRIVSFVIIGAVILSKVLSPQYFIFALCMSLLLATEEFSQSFTKLWALTALWLIVAGLSTWLFPYHYISGPNLPGLASRDPGCERDFYLLPCTALVCAISSI